MDRVAWGCQQQRCIFEVPQWYSPPLLYHIATSKDPDAVGAIQRAAASQDPASAPPSGDLDNAPGSGERAGFMCPSCGSKLFEGRGVAYRQETYVDGRLASYVFSSLANMPVPAVSGNPLKRRTVTPKLPRLRGKPRRLRLGCADGSATFRHGRKLRRYHSHESSQRPP